MPTPEELAALKAAEEAAAAKAEADKKKAEEETPEALKKKLADAEKAKEEFKADMLRYKGMLADQDGLKKKAEEDAAQKEKERLAKDGDFKTLYEKSEERAKDLVRQLRGQAEAFITDKKLSVVQTKAVELGLLPQALQDLAVHDLKGVETLQGDGGTITFSGIDAFLTNLKTERPHWFGAKAAPKVNYGGGNGSGGGSSDKELSPTEILKLEREDPEGYRAYMAESFKKQQASLSAK